MRLPPMGDRVVRSELRRLDNWLRQLGPQMGRVIVTDQGTPSITTQEIDLTNFLYLPGRQPLQRSFGTVIFDTDGNLVAQPLDSIVGLAVKATQTGGNTTTIYFNTGDSGQNYIGRWTFPITGTTPSDNTFVEISAGQTLTFKTIGQGSVIIVGSGASRVTFRTLDAPGTAEFFIVPNTGFPRTGTQTPQLRLPSLNTTVPPSPTDRHTFMMLNSSDTAPFVTGSIAHGNHDGSEMQMLPAGGNGRVLRFNVGETVAATTWTNGGTTIFGTFDVTKTRPGMRVKGNSGLAIYVDENTMIVTVGPTALTVDTPLVGNNVAAVTVQTWGPTWDFEAAIAHSSLTGLSADDHLQYLYLAGRAGGQVVGAGAHTGGLFTDLTIEGRLMIGDSLSGVNFTSGRALDIRHQAGNNTAFMFLQNAASSPAGVASGIFTLLLAQPSSVGYTSGSYAFRGMSFLATGNMAPTGVTVSSATAVFVQCIPTDGGDPGSGGTFGKVDIYRGMDFVVQGASGAATRTISVTKNSTVNITSAGLFVAPIAAGQCVNGVGIPVRTTLASITDASNAILSQAATDNLTSSISFTPIASELVGLRMSLSGRQKPLTTASFVQCRDAGSGSNYVVDANMFEVASATPFDTTGITTWSLVKMPSTVVNPGTVWIFNISAVNNSRHAGNFSIGATATPTAKVHIGAGTTAANTAPLKLTSGTNLTTAEAGAAEYDGSYFYLTHGDAVRTLVPSQRGAVNATAQAAAIGATTLYTPPAAGYYVVHYTLEDTTADVTAGTIQFQVNYTDDIGATNQTGAALAMTATGRDRGSFQIWSNSGAITYQTNLVGIFGTARYALRVRLESLG